MRKYLNTEYMLSNYLHNLINWILVAIDFITQMEKAKNITIRSYFSEWSWHKTENTEVVVQSISESQHNQLLNTYISKMRASGNVLIDIKSICKDKSKTEMQIMIKEELFGQDWIEEETKQIAFILKRFKVEDDEQEPKSQHYNTLNNLSSDDNLQVWKSLMSRGKGQKMSYEEKLYIYSK